ncbi:uncharacterized protein CLUP02_15317 [Colletotrichum lupini]|uniref:Uncharacterized protein n=1 Tax=Colletotrichum lupini TaxID=145971 RepID=A0A9Q8T826_9PEZI|nr:uncharacterized protein CLUP02_15317 [Colletotrichum lupini]UQC89786.1 hypothetical protein CLUP02_15317 [Colletotrichum lupini]
MCAIVGYGIKRALISVDLSSNVFKMISIDERYTKRVDRWFNDTTWFTCGRTTRLPHPAQCRAMKFRVSAFGRRILASPNIEHILDLLPDLTISLDGTNTYLALLDWNRLCNNDCMAKSHEQPWQRVQSNRIKISLSKYYVDELGMSVREGYLAIYHTNQKALLRPVLHTITSSCYHPRRRSFVKQTDSFTLEAHFISPQALVMALAEVGVATAAVAPVAPVAAAITFPVAALAVGAGAVAVRMGLFNTSDTPPRMPKTPKKMLKRLLKVYGKKNHKKLKKRTRYDTNNRNTASKDIRDMFEFQGCKTHTKLLRGVFDIENPPDYEAWVTSDILNYKMLGLVSLRKRLVVQLKDGFRLNSFSLLQRKTDFFEGRPLIMPFLSTAQEAPVSTLG